MTTVRAGGQTTWVRAALILAPLALATLGIVSIISHVLNIFAITETSEDIVASLAVFDRCFVELFGFAAVIALLLRGSLVFRSLAYVMAAFYLFVYAVQAAAMNFGGEFLSRLALQNLTHVEYFVDQTSVTAILVLLAVTIGLPWTAEKRAARDAGPPRRFALGLALLAGLTQQLGIRLPSEVAKRREWLLRSHNLPHASPIQQYVRIFLPREVDSRRVTAEDFETLKRFGLPFDPRAEWPFIHDRIYSTPPPFGALSEGGKPPNVIVMFTEGMSAGSLNVYGASYPDLTPNLVDFSREAMVVRNYLNHTAATNRGLKGQLCSTFPMHDSLEIKVTMKDLLATDYFCLSHYFNGAGYDTFFYSAHERDRSPIAQIMTHLGFKTIVNAEEVSSRYLSGAAAGQPGGLSDKQFFDGLIGQLRDLEGTHEKKPFFMALYNVETHAHLDVVEDGVKYADGGNNALNTIHNYDTAFGRFWAYFKASPLAQNTIIVFTADHCHYPERTYVEAFPKLGLSGLFFDRIPFMVYDPRHRLPKEFDAHNATSVSLAPTLIHLLGMPNVQTAFFGRSIFEPEAAPSGMALFGYGDDYYIYDKDGVHSRGSSGLHGRLLDTFYNHFELTRQLEMRNRIWDAKRNPRGT